MDACEHELEGTMELSYRTYCVKCNKSAETIQAERIAELEREIADGLTPKERLLRAEIEQMPRQTRDQYLVDYLTRLNSHCPAKPSAGLCYYGIVHGSGQRRATGAPPQSMKGGVDMSDGAWSNADERRRLEVADARAETVCAIDPTMLTQFEALCQASDPSQAIDGESITATKLCDAGRRIKELELALALIAEQTEYMVCEDVARCDDQSHLKYCPRCAIRAAIVAVTPQTQGEKP